MVTEEKTEQATGIRLDVQSGIGYIRFAKPPRNLYDRQFMLELNDCVDEVRFNNDIKVVLMVSEIEGTFSAGADIQMLKTAEPDFKSSFCLGAQETLGKIERTPKVFIAVLSGHTVGGGLEIALAADLRFVTDNPKIRIGLPEVKLGVLPGTGGTQRLSRLVGSSRALDLMITGRLLGPQEALDLGIVNYVYPADQLLAQAEDYARNLAQSATRAVGLIKQAVVQGTEVHLDAGFFMERELQNRLFTSEDAKEGIASFVEKRQPQFKGR